MLSLIIQLFEKRSFTKLWKSKYGMIKSRNPRKTRKGRRKAGNAEEAVTQRVQIWALLKMSSCRLRKIRSLLNRLLN